MPKKRKKISYDDSPLEAAFLEIWMRQFPLHPPIREHKFHPTRLWRFDFAWPNKKIAVEIQGMGAGHCTLKAMTKDYTKQMDALLLGWRVVYLTHLHLSQENQRGVMNVVARLMSIPLQAPTLGYRPINRRK